MPKKGQKADNRSFILIIAVIAIALTTIALNSADEESEEAEAPIVNETATVLATEGEWVNFDAPVGQFTVDFPDEPDVEAIEIPLAELEASIIQNSYTSFDPLGNLYAVQFATYPDEIDTSSPDDNLGSALNGLVSASESNVLLFSELIDYKDGRALEFSFVNEDDHAMISGRMILIGQDVYLLMAGYENGAHNEEAYTHFLDSFTIE
jgi:hypothetical protein